MAYKVRLLSPSEKVIPFSEIKSVTDHISLVSGTDQLWERIEIYGSGDTVLSTLERELVIPRSGAEATLKELEKTIQNSYPINAREWLEEYFTTVKSIFTFHLFPDRMGKHSWSGLGRVQNFLKDSLNGIIQADREGFYNEEGYYILWQMYEGASGIISAASLNETGEWVSYLLKLKDEKAVNLFKQGIAPRKGFFSRLFGF